MPTVTVSRGGGWADCFRSYAIVIDGEHRATIGGRQSRSFELSHGSHHVQLRAGLLYSSPMLRVHVDARGVTLACGPNKKLSMTIFPIGRPDAAIWLRAAPL